MKRFTETLKWDDSWYRKLSPAAKCLWSYVCDKCDCTGIIDLDIEAASFSIGFKISAKEIKDLGGRFLATKSGKYLIPKFVTFQYGDLSENCPAHKPIFKRLRENGFLVSEMGIEYPKDRLSEYPIDSLDLGYKIKKGKETEEEKETEEGDARGRSIPPTREQLDSYAEEMESLATPLMLAPEDIDAFVDHFCSNGWKVGGRTPMKNWMSSLRTWARNKAKFARPGQNGSHQKPQAAHFRNEGLEAPDLKLPPRKS